MKESYREGVANRPGPEPCEGSRKAALEALDSLIPPVQILQPYPSLPFDAKHPQIQGRYRVR
jgi:hypothetical protein